MQILDLSELLRSSGGSTQPKASQAGIPEAQIALLEETAGQFVQKPCPFRPGDLVIMKHEGMGVADDQPHLVIDVLPPEHQEWIGKSYEGLGAFRADCIVTFVSKASGCVIPMRISSALFQPYTGEGSGNG